MWSKAGVLDRVGATLADRRLVVVWHALVEPFPERMFRCPDGFPSASWYKPGDHSLPHNDRVTSIEVI